MRIVITIIFGTMVVLLLIMHPIASAQENATDSSETTNGPSNEILERVEERIEEVKRNAKAYIGGITDITDSTIQIQNEKEGIQQISISDQTDFVRINSTTEALDLEEIAIGDFIVAMGYLNGSDVLVSSRFLVMDQPEKTTRTAIYGEIEKASAEEILLLDENGNSYIVESTLGTDVVLFEEGENVEVNISEIETGDTVIAVGELEENTMNARRLQITRKSEIEETSRQNTEI